MLNESIRFIGALVWLATLFFLFFFPPLGGLLLILAIILSILSLVRTRRARHEELLAATQSRARPLPPAPTADDRLAQLQQLLDKGTITQDEYERKRQNIIDEL